MVKENARTSHHTPVIVSWEGTEGGGTWKGDIFFTTLFFSFISVEDKNPGVIYRFLYSFC